MPDLGVADIVLIATTLIALCCSTPTTVATSDENIASELILWYDTPAKSWMMEALPIGNGYMGAMFFGGIDEERIQFNEESLWSGGPGEWDQYNGGNREGAHRHLPQVRDLLNQGKFQEAHNLANKELTGIIKANKGNSIWEGFGSYQAMGDLFVNTHHQGQISDYRRELDISQGVGAVSYAAGEVKHQRAYFGSYPGRVLVFQFSNDASQGNRL